MEKQSIFEYGVEMPVYVSQHHPALDSTKTSRMFEAFSGIGCQAMALKRLNIPYASVGISEIDKYALLSYNAIHGETLNYGDIAKMDEIPPCDICTWSFPCTDISAAGKQKGMVEGTRSNYGYDFLEVVKRSSYKPRVLIMENVPALLSDKFRKDFGKIFMLTERMGYKNFVKVLNAKDYGVAQNRERVFMVSILRTAENPEPEYEFEPPITLTKRLKDYLEPQVDEKYYLSEKAIYGLKRQEEKDHQPTYLGTDSISPTIDCRVGALTHFSPYMCEPILNQVAQLDGFESTGRIYSKDGLCPTINTMGGGQREPKIAEPVLYQRPRGENPGGIVGDICPTISTSCWQDNVYLILVADEIKKHPSRGVLWLKGIAFWVRKLSETECGRLMGVSDEDIEKMKAVVSRSQMYCEFGNGIVVDVFMAVLRPLFGE